MIYIKVDEAYAFDMLSVLDIKKKNSLKDQQNFDSMTQYIGSQIDTQLFQLIIESEVYQEMIIVNQNIYDLINLMRQVNGINLYGNIIDDANIVRYKIKQKLQNEFFLNELVENKTKS